MNTDTAEAELAKERHRNLDIWKNAVALTSRIYELTRAFPKDEIFGPISSLRSASI